MFSSKKIKIGNFVLRIPKDMAWCFTDGEYYENNVIYWLERIVRQVPNSVLYDIGANYGYFSVRFSAACRLVYAFEPVSKTHAVLCKNLEKNHLANVHAFKLGVSDKQCSAEINLYSSSGNNSIYKRSLPPSHSLKHTGSEIIQLITLDKFVKEQDLQPPDIVKIDIEGAELYALQGAKNLISRHRPFIFMEYSSSTCEDAGYAKESLLHELKKYSYQIFGLTENVINLCPISYSSFDTANIANIIAVPAGKTLDWGEAN